MTDSDNESGALSDASEEIETNKVVQSKDAVSLSDGEDEGEMDSGDEKAVEEVSRNNALTGGAEAISSEEDMEEESYQEKSHSRSDVEEGEAISSANSTPARRNSNSDHGPPAKKQRSDSNRDDLEEGELTSDSEEEQVPDLSKNVFRRNNKNHPRVDFPIKKKILNATPHTRRKPEEYGICKFYLRGFCTWDNTCKYTHPTGAQKILWMAECGISDPSIGLNIKNTEKKGDMNPKLMGSVFERRRTTSRRSNGSHGQGPRESPKALPISSESSRSPSPNDKRRRKRSRSISSVSRSSDDEAVPRGRREIPRLRKSDEDSDDGRRRRARSSSKSGSSKSRSISPVERKTTTTLGALLKKKRLESMKRTDSPDNNKSETDETLLTKPQSREQTVRQIFGKNPENEPEIYKKPRKSPTPEMISSSSDNDISDDEKSPRHQARSESPMSASAEAEV